MASYTWQGGTSGNWNVSTNWLPNGIPTSSDDVTLDNHTVTASYTVTLSDSEACHNFTINPGVAQKITLIMAGGTLNVANNIQLQAGASFITGSGTINCSGHFTGSSTGVPSGGAVVTASSGTLTLNGGLSGNLNGLVFDVGSGATLTISGGGVGQSGHGPNLTFISGGTNANFTDTTDSQTTVFLGTVIGFVTTDTMKLDAFGAGDTITRNTTANTVTITNAAGTLSQTYTFASTTPVSTIQFSETGGVDTLFICFMAGTMIRTPDGEVPVETLKSGDLVLTADGVAEPVSWLGRQTVSTVFADPVRSWPIRVKAGALGDNVPARDLLVSPDHALLVDGVLIQAGALVNETSIVRETVIPKVFVYYHVELDDHSLILAENAPAETFVDNVDRLHFDNWAEHEALYPNGKAIEELPYPRAKSRRQVPVDIRVKLGERAQAIGLAEAPAIA